MAEVHRFPIDEPKPERRPTIWEQAGRWPGDFCDQCAGDLDHPRAQRKVRTPAGWQACPRCDMAPIRGATA